MKHFLEKKTGRINLITSRSQPLCCPCLVLYLMLQSQRENYSNHIRMSNFIHWQWSLPTATTSSNGNLHKSKVVYDQIEPMSQCYGQLANHGQHKFLIEWPNLQADSWQFCSVFQPIPKWTSYFYSNIGYDILKVELWFGFWD